MKKLWQKSIRLLALFLAVVLVATTISGNAQAASRKKKVVVLYFSATGTTKSVAKKIKKATKGTLSEIKAADRQTDEDLDWSNEKSRVTREHESANTPAASFMEDLHRRP